MTDDQLPFRLKQSTFRAYEPLIARAIESQGTHLTINPAPLRPTTYAARLRDAILSYDKFRWPASFDSLSFDDARRMGMLTVSHGDQSVVLGPKLRTGKAPGGASNALVNPNHKYIGGIPVDSAISEACIHAFCLLLSQKLISGPVILRAQALDETFLSTLESAYDIAITHNDHGHAIII
jgi:hypothetical protein